MEYEEKVDGVGQAWLSNRGLENGLGDGLEGHSMIPALPTISSGFPILNFTGGGGGIRTRDTVSRIHTFQACAFSRSATPPSRAPFKDAGEGDSTGGHARASRGACGASTKRCQVSANKSE